MKLSYRLTADSLTRALRRLQATRPIGRVSSAASNPPRDASPPSKLKVSRHERRP